MTQGRPVGFCLLFEHLSFDAWPVIGPVSWVDPLVEVLFERNGRLPCDANPLNLLRRAGRDVYVQKCRRWKAFFHDFADQGVNKVGGKSALMIGKGVL